MNKNRIAWPIAAIAATVGFATTVPQAIAAFTSTASSTLNRASAGTLSTIFVDGSGNVLTSPIIQVTNAAPNMATQTTTIRIKNVGSLPAQARLHTANLVSATTPSLNDVLLATVTDAQSHVLYSGNVSGLDTSFASLAAGTTTVLTLAITWPDLPQIDDNPYQDASLSFEVAVDASSISAA